MEFSLKMYLWMLNVSLIDDELWYSAGCVNGIFKTNLLTKKTDWITSFKETYNTTERAFDISINTNDKIYFLPFHCNELAVYNKNSKEINYISLFKKNLKARIGKGFVFNEYIVMISFDKNMPIIMYDFQKNRIYRIKDFLNYINNTVIYDSYIFTQGYYVYKEKLYLAIQGTSLLAQINLKKKESTIIDIEKLTLKETKIHAIAGKGTKLYVIKENGKIVIWDIISYRIESHILLESGFTKGKIEVQSIVPTQSSIWVFLCGTEKTADTILKYNCISNSVEDINIKNNNILFGGFDKKQYGFLFAQYLTENIFVAVEINSSKLLYINEKGNEVKTFDLEYSDKRYFKKLLEQNVYSEKTFQNGIYILCKKVLENSRKENFADRNTCGLKILEKTIL